MAYGTYACAAQGKAAVKGKDGFYEFCKDMEDIKKKPLVMQDGSVDYKNSRAPKAEGIPYDKGAR